MSHYLIATDEAGYGPKLGPLVVASTLWSIPTPVDESFNGFDTLQQSVSIAGKRFSIGDSKKLFKPGVPGSIDTLRHATWSSLRASGFRGGELRDALPIIAAPDVAAIRDTPWLTHFNDSWLLGNDVVIGDAIDAAWSRSEAKLVATRVRVVTASQFNAACGVGGNKADLLSRTTLGLIAHLAEIAATMSPATPRHLDVFCDRHGGRRFYAAVLQHTFPDSMIEVEFESARQSVYRLSRQDERLRIRFTVRGDSFIPVALASMVAKYLREVSMKSLNEYFATRMIPGTTLKPTAGYPADADRFLADIAPIIASEKIDRASLVRSR